ncbi:MAG: hypothetical protein ACP5OR_00960 [Candidatus Dormibacteria bacterium]
MNDRKSLSDQTDPLHTYVDEEKFFTLTAPEHSGSTKTLCLFLLSEEVNEQAREGHFSLISGYTRENEPKCITSDALAVLLIDGGVEGAERLCGRILQLFASLHLEHILTILVVSLPEALTPEHAAKLVAEGRTREAGSVHLIAS